MNLPDIVTGGKNRARQPQCVCDTLRRVTRVVTQVYDEMLRPSGLRVTQFSILDTIARMGEANLRQLENTLAIDQTTLTRSLKLLEEGGPDRARSASRRAHQSDEAHGQGQKGPRGYTPARDAARSILGAWSWQTKLDRGGHFYGLKRVSWLSIGT